mmetsp:Transcript_17111/g.26505  ORF Transcript_17111/g.26505 Transcript_17111/m.26505 type:complete len:352 (+) Transcript_17111:192-1247(+)
MERGSEGLPALFGTDGGLDCGALGDFPSFVSSLAGDEFFVSSTGAGLSSGLSRFGLLLLYFDLRISSLFFRASIEAISSSSLDSDCKLTVIRFSLRLISTTLASVWSPSLKSCSGFSTKSSFSRETWQNASEWQPISKKTPNGFTYTTRARYFWPITKSVTGLRPIQYRDFSFAAAASDASSYNDFVAFPSFPAISSVPLPFDSLDSSICFAVSFRPRRLRPLCRRCSVSMSSDPAEPSDNSPVSTSSSILVFLAPLLAATTLTGSFSAGLRSSICTWLFFDDGSFESKIVVSVRFFSGSAFLAFSLFFFAACTFLGDSEVFVTGLGTTGSLGKSISRCARKDDSGSETNG